MGSISSDQIKDFKQGLAEVIMDEAFFKYFDRIVQFEEVPSAGESDKLIVSTPTLVHFRPILSFLKILNPGILNQF